MNPRVRKFLGMIAVMAFMVFYVVVVVTVGEYVPNHWGAQLAYYGLAGCLWGVPLFPLIRWMNH